MLPEVEIRSQVRQALERFNEFVSTQNPRVLAEFAPGDDLLLIVSVSSWLFWHVDSNRFLQSLIKL